MTTTSTTNLADQTPAQIDGQLYPILEALAKAEHYRDSYDETATRYEQSDSGYDRKYSAPEYRKRSDEYAAEAAKLEKQALPLEAEYDRRPWARYIVVSGGHLHMRSCHTITPGRTMVGLIAEASGMDADQVVDTYQYTACTHCFPDAPVAPTLTPEQEGFCPMSGKNVRTAPELAEQLEQLRRRYPDGWHNYAVARSIKCNCGGYPSLTKADNVRKHKPGTPAA